jgi:hypothetical protein
MDQGVDSITGMDLRSSIAKIGNIKLPATLLFDHPTISDIVNFLVASTPEAAPTPEPRPAAEPLGVLDTRGKSLPMVGFSLRFPGASSNPQSFYAAMTAGVDGASEVPYSRWDME